MRLITTIAFFLLAVGLSAASERQKRQASYEAYGGNYAGAAPYRQQQQPQHQQPQAYHPQQQPQHYPAQPARPAPTRQHASAPDEEEKEEGPHPLQLLLEKSKFECSNKDGYYADSDVGCQAFHYCVSGQKHSMMCPAGTVFHQVHLNCVPEDQSICSNANKFFFVNDYLNKELEQKGPNNTVVYAQRYYPENYAVGDPFVPPQETQGGHRDQHQPPAATYGLGPAYREQSPQPASYQQHAPRPQPAVYQQPRPQPPAHRPQPAAYAPQPAPHQAYAPQPRPSYQQQQQQAYRAVQAQQAQQAQPVQYGYGAQQQQAHQAQALQAQRAYAHQQQQAVAPQQHLYPQQSAPRQRYV
ncbi:uncharacterized protein [Parasteatoda tepidariorum]|nr:extensin isoform X2 [Parasteatoda tepidariorum]